MDDINQRLRCRTCSEVSKDQEYHLLSEYFPEYDKKLSELLLFICHIEEQRESNCCPTEMCESCTDRLKDAYNFALQAQRINKEILDFISIKEEYIGFSEEQISDQIIATNIKDFNLEKPNSYDPLNEFSDSSLEHKINNNQSEEMAISDSVVSDTGTRSIKYHSINNFQEELSLPNKSESKNNIIKKKCQQKEDENEIRIKNFNSLKECVKNEQINKNFEILDSQKEFLRTKQFICTVCNRKFLNRSNFKQHMLTHRSDNDIFKCICCMRKFLNQKNLNLHMQHCHGIFMETLKYYESILNANNKINGTKQIICKKCNAQFSSISALRTHLLESHHFTSDSIRNYSIMNSLGYELHADDSETDSNEEDNDDDGNIEDKSKQKRLYICELCCSSYNRKFKLMKHQLVTHIYDKLKLGCDKCIFKTVSQNILEHHKKTQCYNEEKKYECEKCFYKFMWKVNLNIHQDIIHKSDRFFQRDVMYKNITHCYDEELYKCLWCIRKFSFQNNLDLHIRRIHGIKKNSYETAKCIIRSTTSANGLKEIECKLCNSNFSTISALRSHLLESHISTAGSLRCYSIMNSQGFELHVDDSDTDTVGANDDNDDNCNVKEKNRYKCEICYFKSERKYELSKHQLTMHKPEILPLKCDKCIFKTVSFDILEHHKMTQCYNEEKKLKCTKCSFKFMWKKNLKIHQNLQHNTNEDKDKFSICKNNMKNNIQDHIKEKHPENNKKYLKQLCPICGKSLADLKTHMLRHTGEKPYRCDFCDKGFVHPSALKVHLEVHMVDMPHKCTICDKGFSMASSLKRHMLKHTGERPYKCSYCEKTFVTRVVLIEHTRIHTGERPYVCRDCRRAFTTASLLKKHCNKSKHRYENLRKPGPALG